MQQILTRRQGALLCFWLSVLFVVLDFCYGDHSTVEVVGLGECADCKQKNIQTTQAFSGLRVTVECKAGSGEFERRGVGDVDENGKFKVSLPQDIVKAGELNEECYAQLLSASAAPCPSHDNGPLSHKIVIIKSKANNEKHSLGLVGKLKFSSETCASAFFLKHHLLPKFPPITIPPIVFPPKIFHKHPFFPPPPPPPPSPVYTPPPVPEKPPPVPEVKPPPCPPKVVPPPKPPPVKPPCPPKVVPPPKPPPVKPPCPPKVVLPPKPPPVKPPCPPKVVPPLPPKPPKKSCPPIFKKPLPPLLPIPPLKPLPPLPPVPIYKKPLPPLPPLKPLPPLPIYKKPLPPLLPIPPLKPLPPLPPVPIYKKPLPPLPPLKPLPPLLKIPPKHFFHHPKWPTLPPN